MSAFQFPPATIPMITNGSTTVSSFKATGRAIPAAAVRSFKVVIELTNKTANIKGRFAWRVFDAELDKPGNFVTASNTPTCTGIIDLSADATLNNAMWVQPGVEVLNTTGTAIEQCDITSIVSGRD